MTDCQQCGSPFEGKRGAKFCSGRCRLRDWRGAPPDGATVHIPVSVVKRILPSLPLVGKACPPRVNEQRWDQLRSGNAVTLTWDEAQQLCSHYPSFRDALRTGRHRVVSRRARGDDAEDLEEFAGAAA